MFRLIEAELWGHHEEIHRGHGLTVRRMTGSYGTEWEVEVCTPWGYWRLLAALSTLPLGAGWRLMPADQDEADDGVLVMHYWEDTRNHDHIARASLRQSI